MERSMMKREGALLLAICLLAGPARADHLTPFESGGDLMVECKNGTEMCYAYLLGLAVGMTEECLGWGHWTAEQLRGIVVKFMAANPRQLASPRDVAAMAALKNTFGCKRYH
jgi:Rap1a immunity proteins